MSSSPALSHPAAGRARHPTLAAALLLASLVVPPITTLCSMNGWSGGLSEQAWLPTVAALQFLLTPVGNVASLLLGDRRKLWIKLNYVVLAGSALLTLALWLAARFVEIRP